MDIGQGAGLATASGVRPLLPPIVVGVLARADAGIEFDHTDFAFMESWIWIGALAAIFLAGWLLDRSPDTERTDARKGPEAGIGYGVLCAAMGALLFAASLAHGGETSWPGLIGGALFGFVGYLALARLFMRANRRLFASGDSGVVLGIGRDLATIAATVAIVLLGVLGYVAVIAALVLLWGARGRSEEKYEGLRVLGDR
jgi:hypothetical protein